MFICQNNIINMGMVISKIMTVKVSHCNELEYFRASEDAYPPLRTYNKQAGSDLRS
jgi:hypothetical protein